MLTTKTTHIIGIGGIGMSGIAKLMHYKGLTVQGSNISTNSNVKSLNKLGVRTFIGHCAKNIVGADLLVISSAICASNPEIIAAKKAGIPVFSRSCIMQEITKNHFNICVTGAHGKTSTTALVFHILKYLRPSLLFGGILNTLKTNAVCGESDIMVIEADESDGTFLNITANIAIITNIDSEHLDYYGSTQNIIASFKSYIVDTLKHNRLVIACIDCDNIDYLQTSFTANKNFLTYSLHRACADLQVFSVKIHNDKEMYFDIRISNKMRELLSVNKSIIKGLKTTQVASHELSNLLPSIFTALYYNMDVDNINNAISCDLGVDRRFTVLKIHADITFIDDYAHHPKEIIVTLEKATQLLQKNAKLIIIFEPHKYSRLKSLYQEFLNAFKDTKDLIVLDIYPAGEKEIAGINTCTFIQDLKNSFKFKAIHGKGVSDISSRIAGVAEAGDIVLFLGAGAISSIAQKVVDDIVLKLS